MLGRTGPRWRRVAGALVAAAALTAAGLLAVESPAVAAEPSFVCYNQSGNVVSCEVDPGFAIGFFYSEWYVNGQRDWAFDDESHWWDSCLPGDFYRVRVEVSGSVVFTAEKSFNCTGNG
jgi:hypothetical protein